MTHASLVGTPGPAVWLLLAGGLACAVVAYTRRPRAAVQAPPPSEPTSPAPVTITPTAATTSLEGLGIGTFPMLMAVLDMKDRYTGRHSVSVGRLCRLLAAELGWDETDRALCHVTGLLHDIGKIGVPDAVLRKPGRPTPEEWELLRGHPDLGADALARLPLAGTVIEGVRTHHERWDGSGYPRGLAGEDIPPVGRAVAVCDAFHAMISMRPFRPALTPASAVAEMEDGAGVLFDAEMVQALLRVLDRVDPLDLVAPGEDVAAEWRAASAGIPPELLHPPAGTASRSAVRAAG